MYQLVVPYHVIPDEDGFDVRHPSIPTSWDWEQASDRLDTGPRARRRRRLAIVNVLESVAVVDRWLQAHPDPGSVRAVNLGRGVARARLRAGSDVGAMRAYRAARRQQASAQARPFEDAEVRRRLALIALPIIAMLGLHGAARLLGLDVDVLLGVTPGTALLYDSFAGTASSELDGRTPSPTALGLWQVNGGTGFAALDSGGTAAERISGGSGDSFTREDGANYSTADQYAERRVAGSALNGAFIGVRGQSGSASGYGAQAGNFTIRRFDSGSTTVVASGSNGSDQAIRIEAVGDDITLYYGATGAAPTTLGPTVPDTNYPTGGPFLGWSSNGRKLEDYEWGPLSTGPTGKLLAPAGMSGGMAEMDGGMAG